jgi:hypothetical protein
MSGVARLPSTGRWSYCPGTDEHAQRVCEPLKRGWADFETGRATLLDLARLAEQVADALDNASAPLPQLLAAAAGDLEYAYYTNERDEHVPVGRSILDPVLALMER